MSAFDENKNPFGEYENPADKNSENTVDNGYEENPHGKDNPYAEENPYGKGNPYNEEIYGSNPYNQNERSGYYDGNTEAREEKPFVLGGGYAPVGEPKKNSKGLGIASMVLGIVSVTVCGCSGIGLICAIIGLIFGIITQVKNPSGFGLAGIITSAFGIAFGILGVIFNGLIWSDIMNDIINQSSDLFGDSSSSFNNNNNAIIGVIKFIKTLL